MREIRILGTGCPKCNELLARTESVAAQLSLECHIEKITDINEITSYGVMMTPALVVDGKVVSFGKVPSPAELKELIG